MGASQTSTTNQQATQTADPRMQAAVAPILGQVQNVWQTPYNQAMSPQVAAQNAQQLQAIQGLGGLQTNNPASPFINQAAYYSNQAADPNNVIRMQEAFYNPMASAVQAQLGNTFGQQNAQLLGNAAGTGGIGGSRYAVAAGNLANQQGLAAGQTFAGLQQQAINEALAEQGQISQQAFTQGNLGQEALNTQQQGILAALQGGNLTQAQQQALLNAAQTGAIQQTLFPQQELGAAANIAGIGTTLGGQSYGTGQTTTPVNYLGQILGGLTAGAGLLASDERVKQDVEPIGKTYDGQEIYKFRYINDPTTRIGLMAQEVQKKHPAAVKEVNGTKAVDYNKATAQSAEIGEHRLRRDAGGDVRVPETHFPQLNLNPQPPQQQSGSSGSGGGLPGIGGLSNLSSLGDGLSSLGSSAIEGIGSLGSAIGSGIGELGGAIGGALEGAGEFLPMLALLRDGGSVRQHRAIGGGTGVGLGDQGVAALGGMPSPSSSGLNYNGIQSPLAPYFAQSPQVRVPQINLPQLSLGQQGGNSAQQQQDQTAKQWSDFGSALKQNNVLGNADRALFADFGGGGADFARGGRIHRQDGGLLSLSPEDKQNLDYLRGGAPSWLGGDTGNTPPPSTQPIGPSTLERFLNERRSAALRATPQDYGIQPQSALPQPLLQNASLAPGSAPEKLASAPTMGDLSPTPGPGQYIVRDYDGRPIVTPQTAAPDPALVQRASIQQAAIGSAQTPPPISSPQQPIDRVALGPNTQMPPLALDVIKSNEGFAPNAQWDYKQYSGGYGTRAQPGQTYTPESAQKELLEQTAPLHDFISQNVHVPLTQKQYAGLADFGHNLGVGPGGLTDLLPDINRGDWARVAQRMQHYNQAGGQVLDDLVRRRAMDGALVQNQDVAVNPPAISGGGRRSVLDRPDLQPPKPGETELDKRMAEFGFRPNQPQGLGGSLGRALGIQGGLDPQTANRLVGLGLGMMAQPSVGIAGPGGMISGVLSGISRGGLNVLNQEQQERAQAIQLANAFENQKLREAQTAHQLGTLAETARHNRATEAFLKNQYASGMGPDASGNLVPGSWARGPDGQMQFIPGMVMQGGKGAGTDPESISIARLQAEYAKQYPDKKPLSYEKAKAYNTALTSKLAAGEVPSGWEFDENGFPTKPKFEVAPNSALEFRQRQYDAEWNYKRQMGKKAADIDATNLGREAQAVIVERHADLAAGLAGGWELDDKKLTPDQRKQRETFEEATGPLRGKASDMYKTVVGELSPTSDTPAVINELRSLNLLMEAEGVRLATMGQGQVAEGVRQEFRGLVGNFLQAPSAETYLKTLDFTRKMMQSFKEVPNVGQQKVEGMTGRSMPSPTGQPAIQAAPQPSQPTLGTTATPPSKYKEGDTATGPKGQKKIFHNGAWIDQ